jgi:hypothetical protein
LAELSGGSLVNDAQLNLQRSLELVS